MIVVVSGSRDLTDPTLVRDALIQTCGTGRGVTLFHGGQRGVDTLAGAIGRELGWTVIVSPADWDLLSTDAGPVRNAEMLCKAKRMAARLRVLIEAIALPAPNSKGTPNFRALCRLLKVPCFVQPVLP